MQKSDKIVKLLENGKFSGLYDWMNGENQRTQILTDLPCKNPHKLPPLPLRHSARLLSDLLTFQHPPDAVQSFCRQLRAAQAVVLEGGIGERHPVADEAAMVSA